MRKAFGLLIIPILIATGELESQVVYTAVPNAIIEDEDQSISIASLAGGFNAPRPQFWDIDNNGSQDLFIQRDQKSILFFRATLRSGSSSFDYIPNRFSELDPGFWFRITDLDNSGNPDLLIARELTAIEHYKWNESTQNFDLITDALNSQNGLALSFDPGSIPEFADIDCDGDKDLFLPVSDGSLIFYRNVDIDSNGSPVFELQEIRYQDILINVTGSAERDDQSDGLNLANTIPQGKFGLRHGAGSVSFVDFDSDGDLDLIWGDFFSSGLFYFSNQGTCQEADFQIPSDTSDYLRIPESDPLMTSGFNLSDWVDLTGDGLLDLVVAIQGGAFSLGNDKKENLYFYKRLDENNFELVTTTLIEDIDVGQDSFPETVDINGDRTEDLFVGNSFEVSNGRTAGRIWYFEGIPILDISTFALKLISRDFMADFIPNFDMSNVLRIKPRFADIDDDGDQDLFLGQNDGTLIFFENTGTAANFVFQDGIRNYGGIDERSESSPYFFDWDGDEDLDLFVGNSSGSVSLYENIGTKRAAEFASGVDYLSIDVGQRSVPIFTDANNDGTKDLVVFGENLHLLLEGQHPDNEPNYHIFTPTEQNFLDLPSYPSASNYNIQGTGRDHLITGSVEGGLLFFINGNSVTDIESDLQSDQKIQIYPNPSKGRFTLDSSSFSSEEIQVQIFNSLGQLVQQIATPSNTKKEVQIFTPGVYFLRFLLSNHVTENRTIVIR